MHQGDNTQNFDNHFLELDIENPYNQTISKAVFQAGQVQKTYDNPIFPLYVDFNEDDTKLLTFENTGYLLVYDNEGRPVTCDGCIHFHCKNGVVYV